MLPRPVLVCTASCAKLRVSLLGCSCLQMAQEALADAESAQAAATSRLQAVKARLSRPAPPPAVQQDTGTDAVAADEDPDLQEGGVPVPKLPLAHIEPQEVVLSPEQRRALTEAQAGLEAANNELSAAKTAASLAGRRPWGWVESAPG